MSSPSPLSSSPAPSSGPSSASSSILAGLTAHRVGWATLIAVLVAGSTVWFFENEFLDLLVSTLCVAYTTLLLFTIAGNLSIVKNGRIPREAAQIIAVIAGSGLGTVLTVIVKGRSLETMFTERLSGFVATSSLGIGFGCVVVAVYFYREQNARARAELARMEAEVDAEKSRAEKEMLSARLQLLQAQVEPHFLFNTLAHVQHLVETDPPTAVRVLDSLIRYLRAALPRMRKQGSTLEREVEMVRAYLDIHRLRMGDRFAFEIDIPAALMGAAFPPMMLISLVENAVKHGIDPLPDGGRIRIVARPTPLGLSVTVEDDGIGLSEHMGLGIGLTNIRERLATLYGRAAHLDLMENVPRGVVASIEVPV